MKGRIAYFASALIVVAAALPAATALGATINVPGDQPTITLAIAASSPGDIILVAAGIYPENLTIPHSLTITGAGSATTFISGLPAAGDVITISGITGDVTVAGFTITTGLAATVASNGISISGFTGSTMTIRNNVINGVQSPSGTVLDNFGLIAGYGSTGHLVFTQNTVNGGGSNPVLLERWIGPVDFTNNTIYRGPDDAVIGGKDAIFVMNYGASTITTKQLFSNNTIDMGGGTVFDVDRRGTGITVVAEFTGGPGPGGYTDVEITLNNIINLKPFRRGIGLWDNSDSPSGGASLGDVRAQITCNKVSAATGFIGDHGIRLLGGLTATNVSLNDLSGLSQGFQARPWNFAEPTVFAGPTNNNITGNVIGVQNLGTTSFGAENNWWGLPAGPPGTNGTGIDGPVTVTTFLSSPLPNCTTIDIELVALTLEGNGGPTFVTLDLTLSNPSDQPVSVDFQTNDGTATLLNNDYVLVSGTLTFPPKTTSQQVTVQVNGDLTQEADEQFTVTLSNPQNASIGNGTGTVTIQNDDGLPSVSIAGVTAVEGNIGGTTFSFVVSLSNPTDQPVTVQYSTLDGTATQANFDYAPASGTLTIPAKASSGTIDITVVGDLTLESNETFFVNLLGATNATIAVAQATGTILNDDVLPTMTISDVSLTEGNVGFKDFNFIVRLSNPSDQPITVNYQSADNTAMAPLDYLATGPLTLTFAPKTLSMTATVRVRGDVTFEPDETFFVNLTTPIGATLTDAQGIGTIINDDPDVVAVLLSMFEAATVDEGIELRWQFSDATEVTATWIERAAAVTGPWTRIAAEVSDENGVTVAVDRTAEAGQTYAYRLVAEMVGGQQVAFTPAEGTAGGLPTEFALARVSPNPTTDVARIEYTVAREAQVRLSILDVQGRTVAQVVDAVQRPGRYQAVWNGAGAGGRMPAGVYFVRFDAGGKTGVKRVLLTR